MQNPPAGEAVRQDDVNDSTVTLRTISALGTLTSDSYHARTHFNDLLRAATRHCRRLVGARVARIWILRRGGRRLVARDFREDPAAAPEERRTPRGEGLAGWAVTHQQSL